SAPKQCFEMGTASPSKNQNSYPCLTKKLLPWTFYAILPLVLFRLYFYPYPVLHTDPIHSSSPTTTTLLLSPPPSEVKSADAKGTPCDYTSGKWVRDRRGPLYNGTTCRIIKKGQNCISHGRPDMGYLYWRWKPKQCRLPRFEPTTFLNLFGNKHLAFVGDSMARNQLESLLCMLSTASAPVLVNYTNGGEDDKFRRWHFSSHNITLSVYWSPFLVKGVEKSSTGPNHNELYVDRVDERWAADLNGIDMIVLSIGHWFLHPAVYYEGDSVLGCHYCPGLNHSEIGFYEALRKAVRTTLKSVIERKGTNGNGKFDVILTTFSPSHFEGEWDKFGACSKTKPYKEGQKSLEGMDAEMRQIELEEVEAANKHMKAMHLESKHLRLEALDVTKLSLMRPDGHPGPYMHPFPFAGEVSVTQQRVQNDCVHWCLPGPIDTWNEILLQVSHARTEEKGQQEGDKSFVG
ncbi:hypothetical protein Tsubulata_030933, partial [Turnera subulata]